MGTLISECVPKHQSMGTLISECVPKHQSMGTLISECVPKHQSMGTLISECVPKHQSMGTLISECVPRHQSMGTSIMKDDKDTENTKTRNPKRPNYLLSLSFLRGRYSQNKLMNYLTKLTITNNKSILGRKITIIMFVIYISLYFVQQLLKP